MERKPGRPSKAELEQRQEERKRIDESNRRYEQEFASKLQVQMWVHGLTSVTYDQALQLMKEVHDPDKWIFSDRQCNSGLLEALARDHGWTVSNEGGWAFTPPAAS